MKWLFTAHDCARLKAVGRRKSESEGSCTGDQCWGQYWSVSVYLNGRNVLILHKAEVALFHGVGREFVDESLPGNSFENLSLVIIPQSAAHLFIIHTSSVLSLAPKFGYCSRVNEPENAFFTRYPRDVLWAIFVIFEKLL